MALNLFGGSSAPGLGPQTFGAIGAGVSDIFSGFAASESAAIKAQGDIAEGQAYQEAAQLAQQNEQFTVQSTAIQEAQQQREFLGFSMVQNRNLGYNSNQWPKLSTSPRNHRLRAPGSTATNSGI